MTTTSRPMPLLAHHELNGFGNVGEGMAIQLTRDGRRVLWLAHESPPKNVTAVDVTEPRKPAVIVQTDLPHGEMRSNSLYDAVNPVQEKNGGTVLANLLTGLGLDEVFTRADATGARHFLPDALGSVITLTDSTFTWGMRPHLTALSGPGLTAGFGYDGLGRGRTKTINGTRIEFFSTCSVRS